MSGIMWYLAGLITLLAFADITRSFINPETNNFQVLGVFFVVVLAISTMKSDKVLYTVEILLVFSVPFILFLLGKSFFNKYLSYDSILIVASHVTEPVGWTTISAATYTYTGYINMLIFNKYITKKPKLLWVVALLGVGNLCTSFFIPIGFLGADGSTDFPFPWVATADSMRMELAFVERVLYVFLLLYAILAYTSMFIHWHVGIEMFKGAFYRPNPSKLRNRIIAGA
ncbi:hypothetical protein [Paenibacillus hexagrammi]|uniref:Uncharacterized protein n=1 Tax=Paenibacillus hexagrammi TaxID=2908839 RepID=A0ABY3SEN0_9BACL|nr:hypothetical protein [Paenibacillus sp. YPD9-1]UJF32366.1 hypothetical protein L0M14_22070 [Paenibacillus sp. YPD9-1]